MDNYVLEFRQRIKNKSLKIAVVGLGYVGLPLAVEFAKKGFSVLGLDLDKDRIQHIKRRESYIIDVPTSDLKQVVKKGHLTAGSDFSLLNDRDVILVCVPTPLKRKYHPDISFIKGAIASISKNLGEKALVILESTTYPGTTEEVILPMFESRGLKHGVDFYLCFSPERIDPGNEKFPLHKIPKVVGGINDEATLLCKMVYETIVAKAIPVSSPRVAETAKLLENTFRIVNIGLIDELAMMAHKMKIDIWEVIDAAKTKPFGFMPFYPGPGVGGHCIPKDPLYLYWKAKKFGFKSRFIKLSSDVISKMPAYVVERVAASLAHHHQSLSKSSVLVIGATYKKDIKDLRKSPALDIIEIFLKTGAQVSYHDPLIPYLKINSINLKSVSLAAARIKKFDCVVIATDHSAVDYKLLLDNARMIFDARNVYKGTIHQKVIKL